MSVVNFFVLRERMPVRMYDCADFPHWAHVGVGFDSLSSEVEFFEQFAVFEFCLCIVLAPSVGVVHA